MHSSSYIIEIRKKKDFPTGGIIWYCTIQPVIASMVVYHANMIALGARSTGRFFGSPGGQETTIHLWSA